MLKENLAKNIKLLRKNLKLSQIALAELANVHEKTVIRAESGKKELTLDAIEKIACALGVEPYTLFVPTNSENKNAQSSLVSHITNKLQLLDKDKLICIDEIVNSVRQLVL